MKIVLIALALTAALWLNAQPAWCTWCPPIQCFGSCPGECVCLTPPGKTAGSCWGVGR